MESMGGRWAVNPWSLLKIQENPCRIRVEVRDMTPRQLADFISAIHHLKHNVKSTQFEGYSKWDEWARLHGEDFTQIHSAPFFFAWHRQFLWEVENELRKVKPDIVMDLRCRPTCIFRQLRAVSPLETLPTSPLRVLKFVVFKETLTAIKLGSPEGNWSAQWARVSDCCRVWMAVHQRKKGKVKKGMSFSQEICSNQTPSAPKRRLNRFEECFYFLFERRGPRLLCLPMGLFPLWIQFDKLEGSENSAH
jgi:hypothetical protein